MLERLAQLAATEREIRDGYEKMLPFARAELDAKIANHDPSVRHIQIALARNPFPNAVSEAYRATLNEQVTVTKAAELGVLAEQVAASNDAVRALLRTLLQRVTLTWRVNFEQQ